MFHILLAAHLYAVKPGDTLSQRFGGSWERVCEANRLADCNLIQVGQRLIVVTGTSPQAYAYAQAHDRRNVNGSTGAPIASTDTDSATGYAPARTYQAPGGSFQACVIARESGGNASAVNPVSGAGGLYQFLPSTWHSLGYSGLPENAPVSVQNEAFSREYAQAGTSPWGPYDGC